MTEKQKTIFDAPDAEPITADQHWQGMPEFVQPQAREFAKLIIRFRTQADLDDFAQKIGQKLNAKSQATWHPELKPDRSVVKRYVDDES